MRALVHVGEEAAARRRSIARQRPKDPAGRDAAADAGEQGRYKGEEEEANRACLAPCCLAVDFCKWEGVEAVDYIIETANVVQNGDQIEETTEEAKNILDKDGFGDIATWAARTLVESPRSPNLGSRTALLTVALPQLDA